MTYRPEPEHPLELLRKSRLFSRTNSFSFKSFSFFEVRPDFVLKFAALPPIAAV
jgi:hypothetical protein